MAQKPRAPLPRVPNGINGPVKDYLNLMYNWVRGLQINEGKNIRITSNTGGQTINAIPEEIISQMPFYASFPSGGRYTLDRPDGSESNPDILSINTGFIYYKESFDTTSAGVVLQAVNWVDLGTDFDFEIADVWVEAIIGDDDVSATLLDGAFPGFHPGEKDSPVYNYHIGSLVKYLNTASNIPQSYSWEQAWVGNISHQDFFFDPEELPPVDPPYDTDTNVVGGNVWVKVQNNGQGRYTVLHMGGDEVRPNGPLVAQATLNLVDAVTADAIVMEIHGNHILSLTVDSSGVDIDPPPPIDPPYDPPIDPPDKNFSAELSISETFETDYKTSIVATFNKTPDDGLDGQNVQYYAAVQESETNVNVVISYDNDDLSNVGGLVRLQDTMDDGFTFFMRGLRCYYNTTVNFYAVLENNFTYSTSTLTKVLDMAASTDETIVEDNTGLFLEATLTGFAAAQFFDFDDDPDYVIELSGTWLSDGLAIQLAFVETDFSQFQNPAGQLQKIRASIDEYDTGKSGFLTDVFVSVPDVRVAAADSIVFLFSLRYSPKNCVLVTDETVTIPVSSTDNCWSDDFEYVGPAPDPVIWTEVTSDGTNTIAAGILVQEVTVDTGIAEIHNNFPDIVSDDWFVSNAYVSVAIPIVTALVRQVLKLTTSTSSFSMGYQRNNATVQELVVMAAGLVFYTEDDASATGTVSMEPGTFHLSDNFSGTGQNSDTDEDGRFASRWEVLENGNVTIDVGSGSMSLDADDSTGGSQHFVVPTIAIPTLVDGGYLEFTFSSLVLPTAVANGDITANFRLDDGGSNFVQIYCNKPAGSTTKDVKVNSNTEGVSVVFTPLVDSFGTFKIERSGNDFLMYYNGNLEDTITNASLAASGTQFLEIGCAVQNSNNLGNFISFDVDSVEVSDNGTDATDFRILYKKDASLIYAIAYTSGSLTAADVNYLADDVPLLHTADTSEFVIQHPIGVPYCTAII